METKKELQRRQKEKNSETEIEQLEWDRNIRKGICIADSSIEEGNAELGEGMKAKVINRESLMSCQTEICMGRKRKTELCKELKELDSKIEKKKD